MANPKRRYAPVKPARSYGEQIVRLSDVHGLTIGDPERAERILSTVNYYRLTTYGKQLRCPDAPERFRPGVTLETLYSLYQFDMGLRHALLPVLEFFEVQLRAKIAYRLAMQYGSTGYTNAEHFRPIQSGGGGLLHKSILGKFRAEVRRMDELPFVRHHKTKYGGQFPIWVAVELFSFGMLASLYTLMVEDDQRAVSREYGLSPEALEHLIGSAVDARNICAHYNKLYGSVIEDQPLLPNRYRQYEGDKLFPLVLALADVAGEERVYREMIERIEQLARDFPAADLGQCGFPEDWKQVLLRAG